jgi:hypothetical protein
MYWLNFVIDDVPIMMRPLFVVESGKSDKGSKGEESGPDAAADVGPKE